MNSIITIQNPDSHSISILPKNDQTRVNKLLDFHFINETSFVPFNQPRIYSCKWAED